MRKIVNIVMLGFFLLGIQSCNNFDFGDTNDNPNGTRKIDAQGVLAGTQMGFATVTGRDYLIRPTLYVQWQSQKTYTNEMRYSNVAQSWYGYYVNQMEDLTKLMNYVSNPENHNETLLSKGAYKNQEGVAMIFRAVIMKRVTDTWGAAPYSKAFLGLKNITPEYDTQESIYKQLFEEVKKGRDMLDESLKGPTGDIIFNGNVMNWKKFANSFLLQMSLQLSGRYPSAGDFAAQEFATALSNSAGLIEEPSEEAWFSYENVTGQTNPWMANRKGDYFLSREFTDALKGNKNTNSLNPTSNSTFDPRIEVYSNDKNADGQPYGYKARQKGKAKMSSENYWSNTATLPLMTASYTYLNRAEGAALGWSSENADAMLKMGIEKSYETLDFHKKSSLAGSTEAQAYVAARLADAGSVGVDKVIREEKWVSLFPQGFDAWAEYRRTKTPSLKPAADYLNNGTIPARYRYPSEEASTNTENYKKGLENLTPAEDNNWSKVWWDVN